MIKMPKTTIFANRYSAFLIISMLIMLIGSGCLPWGRGTYQVELFSEMHYSQAYKFQESPRLYPASGSVPFNGIGYDQGLVVTLPEDFVADNASAEHGGEIYRVNCVACHGLTGSGNGPAREFLLTYGGIPPADITGAATVAASDVDLFNFVGAGGRIGYFTSMSQSDSPSSMPVFKKLLNETDLKAVVSYVRTLQ